MTKSQHFLKLGTSVGTSESCSEVGSGLRRPALIRYHLPLQGQREEEDGEECVQDLQPLSIALQTKDEEQRESHQGMFP